MWASALKFQRFSLAQLGISIIGPSIQTQHYSFSFFTLWLEKINFYFCVLKFSKTYLDTILFSFSFAFKTKICKYKIIKNSTPNALSILLRENRRSGYFWRFLHFFFNFFFYHTFFFYFFISHPLPTKFNYYFSNLHIQLCVPGD